jgi:hypothetical protein
MKHTHTHSHNLDQPPVENIFGLPERAVYLVGVFTFYVLLFFAISYFFHQDPTAGTQEVRSAQTGNNR